MFNFIIGIWLKPATTNDFMTNKSSNPLPPMVSGQWHLEKTSMLAAATGSHATGNKPPRECMAAAGYEPPCIGYNEMAALIKFPESGVQTLRTARQKKLT